MKLSIREAERIQNIIERLEVFYPTAECSLDFRSPYQLLIATQLAAQCTDKRVNIVTKDLFEKYKTIEDFANADINELEEAIRSTGFYRNKAKNIKDCCQTLVLKFGGEVPNTMEELLELSGVGRKTANVVLGDVFQTPGIVVDTHAGRLSRRMGLTKQTDPVKVEFELMEIIPKDKWTSFCHRLVYFGRDCCKSQKPRCIGCILEDVCPKLI